MINIQDYIKSFLSYFPENSNQQPWEIVDNLEEILTNKIQQLSDDYTIEGNVAIHKSATVEKGVTLKGTIIISENCFIGAHFTWTNFSCEFGYCWSRIRSKTSNSF